MKISHIHIENFRNFHCLDVPIDGSVVILGENQIGKTNLIYALRLLLDPSLPDSARQLRMEDFWDGIKRPVTEDAIIKIFIDLSDFDRDEGELAVLAEHIVEPDPMVARLTYEFRPIAGLDHCPTKDSDYEFTIYGGDRPENRLSYNIRKWLPVEVLPALRDADADLARWTRSPLRPLLDRAKAEIEAQALESVSESINTETDKIAQLIPISTLAKSINQELLDVVGENQSVETALGFSPADPNKLLRSLRLLFDGKRREISEASLGTANVLYFTLRRLELKALVQEGEREHTFFCIEEPEAHLHPHLQRLVYGSYLKSRASSQFKAKGEEEEESAEPKEGTSSDVIEERLSYMLTTHSPHIASVAPIKSLLLLRKNKEDSSTKGVSGSSIRLTKEECDDVERYLDVSRAEGLFARGILLVEGDAERFLIPTLAFRAGYDLDKLGITVCSVAGADFVPYVKFFGPQGLNIPIAVLTDFDPQGDGSSLGEERITDRIIPAMLGNASGVISKEERLKMAPDNGVFLNEYTFEVDLFKCGYEESFYHAMEGVCSVNVAITRAKDRMDTKTIPDVERFIKDIGYIGKGRFAQRLASHINSSKCKNCPAYIIKAIDYVLK